jgi:phage-related protein
MTKDKDLDLELRAEELA